MDAHDVLAQLRRLGRAPVDQLIAGLRPGLVQRLERRLHGLQWRPGVPAGLGEGLVPTAAVIHVQALEQPGARGPLGHELADRAARVDPIRHIIFHTHSV